MVECYSGSGYAEKPLVIHWEGQRLAVTSVIDRWHEPDGLGFRVLTDDGACFTILYSEFFDSWDIRPVNPLEM